MAKICYYKMVPPRYSEERIKNLRLDDINTLAQAFKDIY